LITGVILAFVFVPTLSGETNANASLGERVREEGGALRKDFKTGLDDGAKALEKAKAAAGARIPIRGADESAKSK
jgi:hypothetical protein